MEIGPGIPVLRVESMAARPPHEIEADSPGGPTFEVVYPTGNVLRFAQPQS
jgi:hypothetical protein